jgi:DNA-binding response OmpR family regulator
MSAPKAPPASRILIVEDDAVVADTLKLYLEHAGHAVEIVRDGPGGLARARAPDVALVVLDWMLPGLNGQEVCHRLRQESSVPILMLTARSSEDDRVRGFETGADDYVPKPFSPREVVARVQALLRRAGTAASPASPPPPLRIGAIEIDLVRRSVRVADRPVDLTPTELRLLETLARHPGRAFSREELVARVFGPDYDGFDRTVDTHITNLRRKIEPGSTPRYIVTVHGIGYRLVATDGTETIRDRDFTDKDFMDKAGATDDTDLTERIQGPNTGSVKNERGKT